MIQSTDERYNYPLLESILKHMKQPYLTTYELPTRAIGSSADAVNGIILRAGTKVDCELILCSLKFQRMRAIKDAIQSGCSGCPDSPTRCDEIESSPDAWRTAWKLRVRSRCSGNSSSRTKYRSNVNKSRAVDGGSLPFEADSTIGWRCNPTSSVLLSLSSSLSSTPPSPHPVPFFPFVSLFIPFSRPPLGRLFPPPLGLWLPRAQLSPRASPFPPVRSPGPQEESTSNNAPLAACFDGTQFSNMLLTLVYTLPFQFAQQQC
jgi:hypothetical protein